jgi:porphobilinogen deaminase
MRCRLYVHRWRVAANAVVGTSSLRRLVLLRESLDRLGRTDVRIEPLRGSLITFAQATKASTTPSC